MRVLDHLGTLLGLLLLLLLFLPTVDCVCHNEDYVICDWGGQQKPDRNYSFYFWYQDVSKPSECKDYIQKDRLNVACQFSNCNLFMRFGLREKAGQARLLCPPEPHLHPLLVRAGKPFNLTFRNLSNHQLLLTWDTPYKRPICLQHSVRFKSNKDTEKGPLFFQIPSVDPEKRYVFYVKSKVKNNCASTNLWSEESSPAFWGKAVTSTSSPLSSLFQTVVIPLASFLILMLLLVALLQMERVRVVLMPRIPNPSKKFEELFTAYQGNFSEWAGISKCTAESFKPNYYENICAITELLPSGGYLSVSSEPTAKSGGPPDPLPDPPPKASPDPAALPP
uniref:Type I cytokine receptor cytokine-binding domain-containing protein n=1 Tax=Pseudonaja textilis TaxID=8673 RepID=A0A670YSB9_PSETE